MKKKPLEDKTALFASILPGPPQQPRRASDPELNWGKSTRSAQYLTHFRYYSSNIGRFLKPDNVVGILENPQSFNLYTYVIGNPIRYNDSTGHFGPIVAAVGVGVIVVGVAAAGVGIYLLCRDEGDERERAQENNALKRVDKMIEGGEDPGQGQWNKKTASIAINAGQEALTAVEPAAKLGVAPSPGKEIGEAIVSIIDTVGKLLGFEEDKKGEEANKQKRGEDLEEDAKLSPGSPAENIDEPPPNEEVKQ